MSTSPAPAGVALLAEDAVPRRPLATTMWMGVGRGRGATTARLPGGGWRRAEQGPAGPVLLEVRPTADRVVLQVWGPAATEDVHAARMLAATRRWAGLEDDAAGFADLVAGHPVLREPLRQLGVPLIGALPRAAESFGRAVLDQLVQGLEAARSTAQLVALRGTPAPAGLWAYPTREALGARGRAQRTPDPVPSVTVPTGSAGAAVGDGPLPRRDGARRIVVRRRSVAGGASALPPGGRGTSPAIPPLPRVGNRCVTRS